MTQLIVVAMLSIAHIAPLGGAAHQHLFQSFTSWPSPVGVVSLAVSVGLLLALMAFFWSDLADMAVGIVRAAKGKRDPGARLAAQLVASTVPVGIVVFGLPFLDVELPPPTPDIIGWATLGGGLLLLLLDKMSMTIKRIEHASFIDMIVVALTQVIAFLVPGVGRSNITMTFARLLGYERTDAARLSLLLGLPALAGLCLLQVLQLVQANELMWQPWLLAVGGVSFLAGLMTLAVMMVWLRRGTFTPFAVYRIVMGTAILVLLYVTA